MQRSMVSLSRGIADFVWQKISGKWTGRVFKERYHQHVIRNPKEVRAALLYVLKNALKHKQIRQGEQDYYSSARYFDGFSKARPQAPPKNLIVKATAWLLTNGWRDLGLIKSHDTTRTLTESRHPSMPRTGSMADLQLMTHSALRPRATTTACAFPAVIAKDVIEC